VEEGGGFDRTRDGTREEGVKETTGRGRPWQVKKGKRSPRSQRPGWRRLKQVSEVRK
jgi:hypothetical protein